MLDAYMPGAAEPASRARWRSHCAPEVVRRCGSAVPSAGERERRPDPERSGSGRAILRYTGAEAGAPLGI